MRSGPVLISILAGMALYPAIGAADSAGRVAFDWQPAERIIVNKTQRELQLLYRDGSRRVFPVVLGTAPEGHKQRQGDGRTPVGRYFVDFKNAESDYYLSVRISYPNDEDRRRARSRGDDPGGDIMIHGMPNDARWPYTGYLEQDWTDGCIAVSNEAMQEIWLAAGETTPIDILP